MRVVEVDGSCHARRECQLREAGWRVLRLDAGLVMADVEAAVRLVHAALEPPP